ncbi:N-acetylglucosaminyl-diphospho-decaprenol L-rhamnosyltransferase [bioreactor metagenome]|uniref:N-acetylglucosaminyl-diphospho-decaprenol L-rhamnosyltransferase n=1 Tax=bioreactor metagenome TaxID=1076179 RepID=A0A645DPR2_9ZZZZ
MENYLISGCIVTHNNMGTIKETLDSLLEYTKAIPFKLYVVDNLSTDGTCEFVKENYPQVELIETHANDGFGAGHNYILPKLDSKYHAIINPDIIIRDDEIAKMAKRLDADEHIGLLSPKICFPDGRLQILGKKNPKLKYLTASRMRSEEPGKLLREYARLDENLDDEMYIENATGCFMFVRTDLFKKVGGFDKRYFMYFEDCDLTREINKTAKVLYYPQSVIYHVWGRDSKKSRKLMLIQISSMVKYFCKWCGQ